MGGPTVPVQNEPDVAPEIPQGGEIHAQSTPGDFGAGVGAGISDIGQTQGHIAAFETMKANQVAHQAASAHLMAQVDQLMYDPQTGAMNQRGQNAFGTIGTTLNAYDKATGEIAQNLGNEQQRQAFYTTAQQRRTEINQQLQMHVAQEQQHYDNQTFTSMMDQSHQLAIGSYQHPDLVEKEAGRQQQAISNYAMRNGLPQEWVQQTASDHISKTFTDVIQRTADAGQDMRATHLYDQWKTQLTGPDDDKVTKTLAVSSTNGASQRLADEFTKPDAQTGQQPELGDVLKKVANTDWDAMAKDTGADPTKLRQATLQKARESLELANQAHAEHINNVYTQAQQALQSNGWKVDELPPTITSQLTNGHLKALQADADWENERIDRPQQEVAYLRFNDYVVNHQADLAKMTPDEFASTFRDQFNKEQWDKASSIYNAVRQDAAQGTKTPEVADHIAAEKRIDDTLLGTPMMPKAVPYDKMTPEQQQMRANFDIEINKRWEDEARARGQKDLSGNDKQKILDDAVRNTVFVHNRFSSDQQVPAAALTKDQVERAYVPIAQIPKPQQEVIRNLANAKGYTLSTDQLQRAMAAFQRGDRPLYDDIISGKK